MMLQIVTLKKKNFNKHGDDQKKDFKCHRLRSLHRQDLRGIRNPEGRM